MNRGLFAGVFIACVLSIIAISLSSIAFDRDSINTFTVQDRLTVGDPLKSARLKALQLSRGIILDSSGLVQARELQVEK